MFTFLSLCEEAMGSWVNTKFQKVSPLVESTGVTRIVLKRLSNSL